jgi:hypothetical protein
MMLNYQYKTQLELKKTPHSDIKVDFLNLAKKKEKDTNEENFLLCKICAHIVTSLSYRVSENGHHTHIFSNPQGIVFEIGCFSSAQGCKNISKPTLEYTWFPGYSWSISVCANCEAHLGWFYQSHDTSFYGLILDNLIDSG